MSSASASERLARHKPSQSLPKTPGALCWQWVRCGRGGCYCAAGARLHGPYLYRLARVGGRLTKCYVPKGEAAAALAELANWREQRREQRDQIDAGWQAWRSLRDTLKGDAHDENVTNSAT